MMLGEVRVRGECPDESESGVVQLLMRGGARAVGLKMMPSMLWSAIPTTWGCRGRGGMCVSAESDRLGFCDIASSGMLGICLFSSFRHDGVGSEKVRVGTASLLPPAPRQNSSPVLAAIAFGPVPGGKPLKVPNVVPDRSSSGDIVSLPPLRPLYHRNDASNCVTLSCRAWFSIFHNALSFS